MPTRFSAINVAALPAPDAIEDLSYEDILAAYRLRLIGRLNDAGVPYDVQALETDPAMIIGQAVQYERLLDRARVNDAVRAVLVPTSWGSNLDALGAGVGTARLPGESDDRFRIRIMLAWEALATTGPAGAYKYFAMSASTDVHDVEVYGPETALCEPGEVLLVVAAANPETGNPEPASPALISAVQESAGRRDRIPLTDRLIVQSATLRPYRVTARMRVRAQFDPTLARTIAERRVIDLTRAAARIGAPVTLDVLRIAIGAADDGRVVIDNIDISEPTENVISGPLELPWCSSIEISVSREID